MAFSGLCKKSQMFVDSSRSYSCTQHVTVHACGGGAATRWMDTITTATVITINQNCADTLHYNITSVQVPGQAASIQQHTWPPWCGRTLVGVCKILFFQFFPNSLQRFLFRFKITSFGSMDVKARIIQGVAVLFIATFSTFGHIKFTFYVCRIRENSNL